MVQQRATGKKARDAAQRAMIQEGIVRALWVPLGGEALGWTFGIAMCGIWLAGVLVFFGPFPLIGQVATFASLAIFYRLCAGYFDACFAGARSGRLEPASTEARGDFVMSSFIMGGGGVLLYILANFIAAAMLLVSVGIELKEPEFADNFAIVGVRTLVTALIPVAFALRASTQSNRALLAIPQKLRIISASGVAYLVPVLIANFALSVPHTLAVMAADAGFLPILAQMLLSSAMCAYVFGAMGAAMGWLANRNQDVDALLG